jgi:hypothetical protein
MLGAVEMMRWGGAAKARAVAAMSNAICRRYLWGVTM